MSIKKTLCVLALSLPVIVPAAQAYDFVKDGVYYNLSNDRKKAIVTYSSLDANAYEGDVVIPSTVKYGMTELQVREIGDLAFFNCQNMTSVKMPDNIILIGQQAFSHCYSLTEIQLPASLYSIGDYAFEYCDRLTSVSIPKYAEMVGYAAFQMCSGLERIDVAEGNMSYCSEEGVLYSASRKKLVCFPASCEIKELSLPDGLTEIEDAAFTPAYFLEGYAIGQALADVPPSTLSSCLALTEITVDPANESLSSADGVLFDKKMQKLIQYPTARVAESYAIPEGVSALEDMSMAGTVITELTLPSTLTNIGMYAFYGCCNFNTIKTNAKTPPTVQDKDNELFISAIYENCVLHVPDSSKQAYSSAKGWRNFKNISSEGTHGIESIGTDSADSDSSVNLFDTNGRKLYSGPLSGINVSEHGIYVIQKGNSTFKIRL